MCYMISKELLNEYFRFVRIGSVFQEADYLKYMYAYTIGLALSATRAQVPTAAEIAYGG